MRRSRTAWTSDSFNGVGGFKEFGSNVDFFAMALQGVIVQKLYDVILASAVVTGGWSFEPCGGHQVND